MGIIAGLKDQGKRLLSRISMDWLILAIILLASTASFGLGFLAGKDVGEKSELKIVERPFEEGGVSAAKSSELGAGVSEVLPEMNAGGQYVASKTGKSYHAPWCPGAKQIKEENKVWFDTKEEAEARGYAAAGNCPGI